MHTDKVMANVTVSPARKGPVEITIQLETVEEKPLAAKAVSVTLTNPRSKARLEAIDAERRGEDRWFASVKLPAAAWVCVEFGLDSSMGTLQTWINGNAVTGLILDKAQTPDIDANWLGSMPTWVPKVTDLKIGWESYGGTTNTVWIDDVALGTRRIGC